MYFCVLGVFGVEGEMKSLSVMEGDSVTLHTDTDIQGNDAVIEWMFGAENPDTVIAEIFRQANISAVTDERFRDRVKMDSQTGSLTITNIRNTDSGLYKVEITTNSEAEKTFNVTVYGEYSSRIFFIFRSVLAINLYHKLLMYIVVNEIPGKRVFILSPVRVDSEI